MLMTTGKRPVPVAQYETAIALRHMALMQDYLPKFAVICM